MQYQIADSAMLAKCQELLDNSGYYSAIQLSDIGGMVVVGVADEKPVACVWVCLTGTRAYVDYLVADPAHKGAGVRLLVKGIALLRRMGVREIKFDVHQDNEEVFRIAAVMGGEYCGYHAKYSIPIGESSG